MDLLLVKELLHYYSYCYVIYLLLSVFILLFILAWQISLLFH